MAKKASQLQFEYLICSEVTASSEFHRISERLPLLLCCTATGFIDLALV